MGNWLRPLLMMFYAPTRGMGEVRERVAPGQAALLAVLAHGLHTLYAQWPEFTGTLKLSSAVATFSALLSAAGAVLLVALVFVPLIILVANMFDRRASFGLVIRQEYAATAATTFYALAAASLFAIVLAFVVRASGVEASMKESFFIIKAVLDTTPPEGPTEAAMQTVADAFPRVLLLVLIQPLLLFTVWAVAAVREVFRLSWLRSLVVIGICTVLMMFASPLLVFFSAILGSPFLLLLIFFILRGYFSEVSRTQRARAAFKQNLEAATLNPADASAHYNLGLIHLQRKEADEARVRFERAIEIDADEVDAHYQLGRLAREQHRLPDAIKHFGDVVARAPQHSLHEIWREIGATYLAAGQFPDALDALERFLDERQSDPEGLYLAGRALDGVGRRREAVEKMQAVVEAVKTAPAYKYRADKRWLYEAQQFLRSQA